MSMAAGEYVSVQSQADTERADLDRERKELATDSENEHAELAEIDGSLDGAGADAAPGRGRAELGLGTAQVVGGQHEQGDDKGV